MAIGSGHALFDDKAISIPANEVTKFPTSLAGSSPFARWKIGTGPDFKLGTVAHGSDNSVWIVIEAAAALAAAATITVPTQVAVNVTTYSATAGTGFYAFEPFAINERGFVRKVGAGLVT